MKTHEQYEFVKKGKKLIRKILCQGYRHETNIGTFIHKKIINDHETFVFKKR